MREGESHISAMNSFCALPPVWIRAIAQFVSWFEVNIAMGFIQFRRLNQRRQILVIVRKNIHVRAQQLAVNGQLERGRTIDSDMKGLIWRQGFEEFFEQLSRRRGPVNLARPPIRIIFCRIHVCAGQCPKNKAPVESAGRSLRDRGPIGAQVRGHAVATRRFPGAATSEPPHAICARRYQPLFQLHSFYEFMARSMALQSPPLWVCACLRRYC
jgi:hypothetical protein